MNERFIMEQLFKQRRNLEIKGYQVAYICVFGSQNYGLDLYTENYKSDLDMKAVIIPDLDDIVNNSKPVSTKYVYEYGEVDVKDIRVFVDTLAKTNPSYIETLCTPYYIINSKYKEGIKDIINNRDLLVMGMKPLFAKAIYGMMLEKQNNMTHLYPKTEWKVKKWGFDGKASSHCIRLCDLMNNYFVKGYSLTNSFNPSEENKEIIIKHKLNEVSLEDAVKDINKYIEIGRKIKESVTNLFDIDPHTKNKIIKISKQIIKDSIIDEVKSFY